MQFWRLITSNFVFSTSSEVVLGLFLLYSLRELEKRFGTRKFASALTFYSLASTSMQLLVMYLIPSIIHTASGPYFALFGLLVPYCLDVPYKSKFSVLGLPLTNKSWLVVLGSQVALTGVPGSLISAACGLFAGFLFRVRFLPFHRLRLPRFLFKLVGMEQAPRYQAVNLADLQRPHASTAARAPTLPSQEAIDTLTALGFDEEAARRVLHSTNNDLARASNLLLDQQ